MKHVVTYKSHICPKCKKKNSGSAGSILDLLICPKCVEKYNEELMPLIEKMVREYFTYENEYIELLKKLIKNDKNEKRNGNDA